MATDLQRFGPASRLSRMALAMLVGALVLLVYQNMPLARILSNAGFYFSWLASGLMAFALISTVRRVLARIFKNRGGQGKEHIRFLWALLGGVCLPCLMALAMVYGLLEGLGGGFAQSGYLQREFPLVVLFIVILNLTYLALHYHSQSVQAYASWQSALAWVQAKDSELSELKGRLDDAQAQYQESKRKIAQHQETERKLAHRLAAKEAAERDYLVAMDSQAQSNGLGGSYPVDSAALLRGNAVIVGKYGDECIALERVACLQWANRAVWVTLDNGRQAKMRVPSLRKAMDVLPAYWFVRISDTSAIARKYLMGLQSESQERKLRVRLQVKKRGGFNVLVSRAYIPRFRVWLALGQNKESVSADPVIAPPHAQYGRGNER